MCIAKAVKYLDKKEKASLILSWLISYCNEDIDNDSKTESKCITLKLFDLLADDFETDLCELFVIHQIASLADDQSPKVRKAVAVNLTNVARIVSIDVFRTKIINIYTE